MLRILLVSIAILSLCLGGCGSSEFDGGAIKTILESAPLELSNEQVTLNDTQVECGVRNDLWDPPEGNLVRLTQKGRDLKFTDDIRLRDPEIHQPYTQVSGAFSVRVSDVSKIRDVAGGKLADVKLGVVIAHECFTTPLPLMGIRKGKFTPDAAVVFRFKGSGTEYTLDKLMH